MRHCLCLDSAHIPGLKDMVPGVISVCFSTPFGRLVPLKAVGTEIFLCPGDQRGLRKDGEDFLHVLCALSLISLRSLPHTSCVYFLVGLIPSSPRACLRTAAEGSSQTTEEIALLACLSYPISTLSFFPSFNPCGLDFLKVSRKPHPLVPPKISHPEAQGLIPLEHGVGKQCKPVHVADSALLLLLLSLLSDVSLLTGLLLR